MSLQKIFTSIEQFLETLGSWKSLAPDELTPSQLGLLTTGAFLAVSLLIFLTGRLMIGFGRNKTPQIDVVGSKRPLVFGTFTEVLAWLLPVSKASCKSLRKELMRAGYYHRKALEEYLGFRNASVAAWLIFVGFAVVAMAEPDENLTPKILIGAVAVLALLYAIPRLVLSAQSSARSKRIQYSLPDALDMINMTITGGLPMRQAIERVGGEMNAAHPDIACELAIVNRQAEAGSLDQALRQFAGRIDLPDVTALATMVRHAERLGGNIASAFQDFSDGVRRTRRQQAEERGNKASVKLLFPVVFFLTPPIYILLLGPAVIELKGFMQRENQPGGALSQSPAVSLEEATRPSQRSSASLSGL